MTKFKVGETVVLEGHRARVVWLSENANEIEAMDEYIVEFEDKRRQFVVSSTLQPEQDPALHERDCNSEPGHRQAY